MTHSKHNEFAGRPRLTRREESVARGGRRGFTLVELLIVMVIIGIILAFILSAAFDSLRTAELRATQGLVQKLETAMNDRVNALTILRPEPSFAHIYMAEVYGQDSFGNPKMYPTPPAIPDRASVIAQFDFFKAEVPDVFVLQVDPTAIGSNLNIYPLNFAAQPYNGIAAPTFDATAAPYLLPLGAGILNDPSGAYNGSYSYGSFLYDSSNPTIPVGTGIYGASYTAAAGVYKNLGYLPTGYDGIDNDGDGLVDEMEEGVNTTNSSTVLSHLSAHTHNTARSEMLYALLVEGQGPFGSVFQPDDFSPTEVGDTDGDGLPEFIDAWGQPLQFYRWPIFYHSDIQHGYPDLTKIQSDLNHLPQPLPVGPYASIFEAREQNPLDPNQQLMSPSWIVPLGNFATNSTPPAGYPFSAANNISAGAMGFQTFFHLLIDPLAYQHGGPSPQTFWDRSNTGGALPYYPRRAYFTKFLIISGGPDKAPGVARLGVDYQTTGEDIYDGSGAFVPVSVTNVLQIENTAASIDPNQWQTFGTGQLVAIPNNTPGSPNDTTNYLQFNAAPDDISNHTMQAAGGFSP